MTFYLTSQQINYGAPWKLKVWNGPNETINLSDLLTPLSFEAHVSKTLSEADISRIAADLILCEYHIREVRAKLACAYAGRWIGRELGWA